MAKNMLMKNFDTVEKILDGSRKSNRICATKKAAKILQKVYPIKLNLNEPIHRKLGLYMFSVTKINDKNSS